MTICGITSAASPAELRLAFKLCRLELALPVLPAVLIPHPNEPSTSWYSLNFEVAMTCC